MKIIHVFVIAGILLSASCGNADENAKKGSPAAQPADTAETRIPGIDKLSFTDTIHLRAGNEMRFDQELFRVKAGEKDPARVNEYSKKIKPIDDP